MNHSNDSSKSRQTQSHQPGSEQDLQPPAQTKDSNYKAADKLKGKVALITGGDSGIGRAIAVLFAKEGADVMISYLEEEKDALDAKKLVNEQGGRAEIKEGNLQEEQACKDLVEETVQKLGRLDILVNNAAEQHLHQRIEDISAKELKDTFATNIFSYFYVTQAALTYLKSGGSIINTTSVVARAFT